MLFNRNLCVTIVSLCVGIFSCAPAQASICSSDKDDKEYIHTTLLDNNEVSLLLCKHGNPESCFPIGNRESYSLKEINKIRIVSGLKNGVTILTVGGIFAIGVEAGIAGAALLAGSAAYTATLSSVTGATMLMMSGGLAYLTLEKNFRIERLTQRSRYLSSECHSVFLKTPMREAARELAEMLEKP
jgi:hypothetical protein